MQFGGTVEAIKDGEIVRMPESQAVKEDLFILRKISEPASSVIYESFGKKERAIELAVRTNSRLEAWRAGKFNFKNNNVVQDLVPNFQWEISKARRVKNISRKQLAFNVGVSEEEIKSIELGELPRDDFVLISKIESYLGINLRKNKVMGAAFPSPTRKLIEQPKIDFKEEEKKTRDKRMGGESIFGEDIEVLE